MLRLLATPTMSAFLPSRSMLALRSRPRGVSGAGRRRDWTVAPRGTRRGRHGTGQGLRHAGRRGRRCQRLRRLEDGPLEDLEPLLELLLGDHQPHHVPDDVAVRPGADDHEAALVAALDDLLHQLLRRLFRGAVAHELDRLHRPGAADAADRRALLPHPLEAGTDLLADLAGLLGEVVLLELVEHRERRRRRDRVAAKGAADASL